MKEVGKDIHLADSHNHFIQETLKMAREMIVLSDEGEICALDDSCRALYGLIRDYGYAIQQRAERERELHKAKGIWDAEKRLREPNHDA